MIPSSIIRQRTRAGAYAQRQRRPVVLTLPAPIGGWNARDSIDAMPETDAIRLDNWFPAFGKVEVRRGFSSHATGVGADTVETLAVFEGSDGTEHLIACSADGEVENASSAGAATNLGTGFTNGRWQWANANGVLVMVNGADAPQSYDGSTLGALTVSGSGLTVSDLIGVNYYKSRGYFIENGTASFWYGAVNATAGALTEFPLGAIVPDGGELMQMVTWTRDGGAGVDDYAAFIMSSGAVVVYTGSNPGSASDWALVGVFRIGRPLGRRAAVKFGGDVLIATDQGYVVLGQVLGLPLAASQANIASKIVNAVIDQALSTGDDFGWQAIQYPRRNMLIVNYPAQTGVWHQHVLNLATGAWCRFTGQNGASWAIYGGNLYFGGAAGVVYKADTGVSDAGNEIVADAISSWSYLGGRSARKRLTMVRPVLETDGPVPVRVSVAGDYQSHPNAPAVTFGSGGSGTLWSTAPWGTFPWGSGLAARPMWLPRSADGFNFSTRMIGRSSTQSVAWTATGYALVPGGVL